MPIVPAVYFPSPTYRFDPLYPAFLRAGYARLWQELSFVANRQITRCLPLLPGWVR